MLCVLQAVNNLFYSVGTLLGSPGVMLCVGIFGMKMQQDVDFGVSKTSRMSVLGSTSCGIGLEKIRRFYFRELDRAN